MKRLSFVSTVFIFVIGFWVSAQATLIDQGNGTIYDTDLDITWLQDAGMGGRRNWWDAKTWAENLVFAGYDDWRLPTTPGTIWGYTDEGEMGHLYYTELGNVAGELMSNTGPFINLESRAFWTGTEWAPSNDGAWVFGTWFGHQDPYSKSNSLVSAWAVRDVDVSAPVPVPATLLLLGSGLVGLAGFRRKFKKA